MTTFHVPDMTCGHCAAAIAQAVKAVDASAAVEIDLASKQVRVGAATASAQALSDAIRSAGYQPVPLESPRAAPQ